MNKLILINLILVINYYAIYDASILSYLQTYDDIDGKC